MVTITEVPDDQAFNIPRTAPVVVGVPGGRQSRPAASQPNSQPRKRNYPRHDRILELEGDESSEDEPLGGPRDMSEAESGPS